MANTAWTAPPAEATKCVFALTWANRNQALNKNTVKMTLDYLQDVVSKALDGKYVVQTGDIEQTSKILQAEITCLKVPAQERAHVLAVMEKILSDGSKRKDSLSDKSQVPTPDVYTFEQL